jgi:hypothetical protein
MSGASKRSMADEFAAVLQKRDAKVKRATQPRKGNGRFKRGQKATEPRKPPIICQQP